MDDVVMLNHMQIEMYFSKPGKFEHSNINYK